MFIIEILFLDYVYVCDKNTHFKNLFGKDLNTEKDWRQKEKRAAEAEMVKLHYQLNGHEL